MSRKQKGLLLLPLLCLALVVALFLRQAAVDTKTAHAQEAEEAIDEAYLPPDGSIEYFPETPPEPGVDDGVSLDKLPPETQAAVLADNARDEALRQASVSAVQDENYVKALEQRAAIVHATETAGTEVKP